MICINIKNQQETGRLALKLASLAEAGDMYCLSGDLGAGKTTFTQYFAKGLGVEDYVTSPTFTILQEYQGKLPLYHFDVYRITDPYEMEDIGYEEYFYGEGVCVVEWPSLIEAVLPEHYLKINMTVEDEFERKICFEATNDYYRKKIEELLKE